MCEFWRASSIVWIAHIIIIFHAFTARKRRPVDRDVVREYFFIFFFIRGLNVNLAPFTYPLTSVVITHVNVPGPPR